MERTRGFPLRILAFILALSLSAEPLLLAQVPTRRDPWPGDFAARLDALARDPSALTVPADSAEIGEFHKGDSDNLIIHIQDAHTNLGAQKNLADVLDRLTKQYGIDLVFVEGGSGDDSLSFLRESAPLDVRKRTALRFLEKGEISGEEYLDIVASPDQPFQLWGVEDPALYEQSLVAYARVSASRRRALRYIDRLGRAVQTLKSHFYPREFLDFERAGEDFRRHKITFSDYHATLAAAAAARGVSLDGLPEFERLGEIRALEQRVDFAEAEKERAEIGRVLRTADPDWVDALGAVTRIGLGGVPPAAFYADLRARIAKTGIDPARFRSYGDYLQYLDAFSRLDARGLLSDIDAIEGRVADASGLDDVSVKLRDIGGRLELFRGYFSLKLRPAEFLAYKLETGRFDTASWTAFLNRRLIEIGRGGEALPYEDVLEARREEIEEFYNTVDSRDHAFVARSLAKMSEAGRHVAVLICGGYHTPHLKKLLKSNGASYVVLTPRVDDETDVAKYERVLLGGLDPSKRWLMSAKANTLRPRASRERILPLLAQAFGQALPPAILQPAGAVSVIPGPSGAPAGSRLLSRQALIRIQQELQRASETLRAAYRQTTEPFDPVLDVSLQGALQAFDRAITPDGAGREPEEFRQILVRLFCLTEARRHAPPGLTRAAEFRPALDAFRGALLSILFGPMRPAWDHVRDGLDEIETRFRDAGYDVSGDFIADKDGKPVLVSLLQSGREYPVPAPGAIRRQVADFEADWTRSALPDAPQAKWRGIQRAFAQSLQGSIALARRSGDDAASLIEPALDRTYLAIDDYEMGLDSGLEMSMIHLARALEIFEGQRETLNIRTERFEKAFGLPPLEAADVMRVLLGALWSLSSAEFAEEFAKLNSFMEKFEQYAAQAPAPERGSMNALRLARFHLAAAAQYALGAPSGSRAPLPAEFRARAASQLRKLRSEFDRMTLPDNTSDFVSEELADAALTLSRASFRGGEEETNNFYMHLASAYQHLDSLQAFASSREVILRDETRLLETISDEILGLMREALPEIPGAEEFQLKAVESVEALMRRYGIETEADAASLDVSDWGTPRDYPWNKFRAELIAFPYRHPDHATFPAEFAFDIAANLQTPYEELWKILVREPAEARAHLVTIGAFIDAVRERNWDTSEIVEIIIDELKRAMSVIDPGEARLSQVEDAIVDAYGPGLQRYEQYPYGAEADDPGNVIGSGDARADMYVRMRAEKSGDALLFPVNQIYKALLFFGGKSINDPATGADRPIFLGVNFYAGPGREFSEWKRKNSGTFFLPRFEELVRQIEGDYSLPISSNQRRLLVDPDTGSLQRVITAMKYLAAGARLSEPERAEMRDTAEKLRAFERFLIENRPEWERQEWTAVHSKISGLVGELAGLYEFSLESNVRPDADIVRPLAHDALSYILQVAYNDSGFRWDKKVQRAFFDILKAVYIDSRPAYRAALDALDRAQRFNPSLDVSIARMRGFGAQKKYLSWDRIAEQASGLTEWLKTNRQGLLLVSQDAGYQDDIDEAIRQWDLVTAFVAADADLAQFDAVLGIAQASFQWQKIQVADGAAHARVSEYLRLLGLSVFEDNPRLLSRGIEQVTQLARKAAKGNPEAGPTLEGMYTRLSAAFDYARAFAEKRVVPGARARSLALDLAALTDGQRKDGYSRYALEDGASRIRVGISKSAERNAITVTRSEAGPSGSRARAEIRVSSGELKARREAMPQRLAAARALRAGSAKRLPDAAAAYGNATARVWEALENFEQDPSQTVEVLVPVDFIASLARLDGGYFKAFAKLFLAEAAYAKRLPYGENVRFAPDGAAEFLAPLLAILNELKEESAGDAAVIASLETLGNELEGRAPPVERPVRVNLFDSALSADSETRSRGDINVPVDWGVGRAGELGLPPFRALIRLSIQTARDRVSRDNAKLSPALRNAWQTLLGPERRLAKAEPVFIAVLTGAKDLLPQVVRSFAIRPIARIPFDALFESIRSLLTTLAKSA